MAYCKILEKSLLSFAKDRYDENNRFQQDNAEVHTSAHTKQFFFDENIDVLDWSSRTPDWNPIENLWGYLVTKFNKYFREFGDTESLIESIMIS